MVRASLSLPLGVLKHSSVWALSAKQCNEALAWESLVQTEHATAGRYVRTYRIPAKGSC